ncbi:MAG: UTP--glucose-1-phosphate uridylyltransferase, partial [Akkermansia sp.]
GDAAIGAFHRCFDTLVTNQSGMIPESSILPASDVTNWDDIMSGTTPASADIISQSVCIKLNGGLGTSMGLQKAKSLLPVKGDLTFLDLIVKQVKHLRDISGTPVRLLLMNSFSTSKDTLAYLEKYAKDGFNNPAEMELMQNRVPKILQDSLTPATWAQNPDQEWCPPGHGDIYPALLGSGWLDRLLADGVKYAFISNADNLGAQIDLRFLRWFAESGAPFVMEVTRRTEADKKGGHLAIRRSDGQLILREVAQCPDDDLPQFQSINEHRFFNTNSLWIRLDDLRGILNKNDGVLPLPTIRNNKTIDPRDPSSPAVYQLETAMGAGIECFPGAKAVNVPRSRFFPVKTTSDLLLLRSDAINIDQEGKVSLAPSRNGIA